MDTAPFTPRGQGKDEKSAPAGKRLLALSLVMLGIIAVLTLLGYGFSRNPHEVPSPLLGKAAPAFRLPLIDSGKELDLQAFQGRPLVLNFWASWCVACREEAPVFQEFHLRQKADAKQAQIVGIAVQDNLLAARKFARTMGKDYPLLLDAPNGEASLAYGLYGVPETFFIDARGVIRHKHVGAVTREVMEAQISRLQEVQE